MNKYNSWIFYLGLFAFLLPSCEDVVDLPTDSQAELVVFSNFSDQNGLEVYVYKTQSVIDNEPTEYIEDATVKVYEGSELIEELVLVNLTESQYHPPYYKTSSLVPKFDVEYTILVQVDGYEAITAKNSIPTPVNLESVSFEPNVTSSNDTEVFVDFEISVSLKDPIGIDNFYHLKFYQQMISYSIGENGDTVLGETVLKFPATMNEVNEEDPPVKYVRDQSFLIEDSQFDGQLLTLDFQGNYTFDPSKFFLGDFLIELRTVSEAYYLYHDSLNRQNQNGSQWGDGVVVFNNIDNGLGNFSGFTSKVNSFKLPD